VFILWGAFAGKKESLIDANKHLILKSVHPSPLSAYRGFFGCNHFELANDYLKRNNLMTIKW
jgi:uracil-DNA glycosylase